MKRILLASVAVLCLSVAAGCTYVASAQGGNTSMTNGAWYTETTGLSKFMPFSSKVYYCPPTSGGAATCMEAEMIENANPGTAAGGGAAPAAPAAPAGGGEDMGEFE